MRPTEFVVPYLPSFLRNVHGAAVVARQCLHWRNCFLRFEERLEEKLLQILWCCFSMRQLWRLVLKRVEPWQFKFIFFERPPWFFFFPFFGRPFFMEKKEVMGFWFLFVVMLIKETCLRLVVDCCFWLKTKQTFAENTKKLKNQFSNCCVTFIVF